MLSFFNINYPEDLERANEIAREADRSSPEPEQQWRQIRNPNIEARNKSELPKQQ
jgi:NDP-sugar pyrophosphorylase family protein